MVNNMKVLNYGSLNYDHIYQVDHFVNPKETMSCLSYQRGFGGKGLNQSIALAKAGMNVYHAGKVGSDGQDFIDYLNKYNVNTEFLVKDDNYATGHAIIQICDSENSIIIHGGANRQISKEEIDKTLSHFQKGDVLLLQNEINNMEYIINSAKEIGMYIAFNVAPISADVFNYPLDKIDLFIVNEIEAAGLAKTDSQDYQEIINELQKLNKEIVMTVGKNGSYYINGDKVIYQKPYIVKAVDTTAAGDTFTGYYLASRLNNKDIEYSLDLAAKASSITVSYKGAADAIPKIEDL